MIQYFKNLISEFKNDTRGIMNVEFVILVPFMLLWFLISFTLFDVFKSYLRASKATYTAIDLVSRQTQVDAGYIGIVDSIFQEIIELDGLPASIIITSILKDNDNLTIDWSKKGSGGVGLSDPAAIPLSYVPDTLQNGEYLLMIQSTVPYVPIATWDGFGGSAMNFRNTVAVIPRFDVRVAFDE